MRRLLVILALAACGDPLADGAYLGTPMAVLKGRAVAGMGDPGPRPVRPHVGIIWPALRYFPAEAIFCDVPVEPPGPGFGPMFFGAAAPIVGTSFPASFRFELHEPPDTDAFGSWRECDGRRDGRMALGFLMVFDDLDRDGTFTEESMLADRDRAIGYSDRHMIVFIEQPPREGGFAWNHVFANPGKARRGYHIVEGVCGDGELELDRVRILDPEEEIEVVITPIDENTEVEPRCLSFLWPGGL